MLYWLILIAPIHSRGDLKALHKVSKSSTKLLLQENERSPHEQALSDRSKEKLPRRKKPLCGLETRERERVEQWSTNFFFQGYYDVCLAVTYYVHIHSIYFYKKYFGMPIGFVSHSNRPFPALRSITITSASHSEPRREQSVLSWPWHGTESGAANNCGSHCCIQTSKKKCN